MSVDLSVIIPIYRGYQYIEKINHMSGELFKCMQGRHLSAEVILVEDTPIDNREQLVNVDTHIIIKKNDNNVGIHRSRIAGLRASKGDWILFLDQDDNVDVQILTQELSNLGDGAADVQVFNGIFQDRYINQRKIYSNISYGESTTKESTYLYMKDPIISPGHCLIRKSKIPSDWLVNTLEYNGADDYFLWLLMLDKGSRFAYTDLIFYQHNTTGVNVSFNVFGWEKSIQNMLEQLRASGYPERKYKAVYISQKIKLLYVNRKFFHLIILSLFHPVMLIRNLMFRLANGSTVVKAGEIG